MKFFILFSLVLFVEVIIGSDAIPDLQQAPSAEKNRAGGTRISFSSLLLHGKKKPTEWPSEHPPSNSKPPVPITTGLQNSSTVSKSTRYPPNGRTAPPVGWPPLSPSQEPPKPTQAYSNPIKCCSYRSHPVRPVMLFYCDTYLTAHTAVAQETRSCSHENSPEILGIASPHVRALHCDDPSASSTMGLGLDELPALRSCLWTDKAVNRSAVSYSNCLCGPDDAGLDQSLTTANPYNSSIPKLSRGVYTACYDADRDRVVPLPPDENSKRQTCTTVFVAPSVTAEVEAKAPVTSNPSTQKQNSSTTGSKTCGFEQIGEAGPDKPPSPPGMRPHCQAVMDPPSTTSSQSISLSLSITCIFGNYPGGPPGAAPSGMRTYCQTITISPSTTVPPSPTISVTTECRSINWPGGKGGGPPGMTYYCWTYTETLTSTAIQSTGSSSSVTCEWFNLPKPTPGIDGPMGMVQSCRTITDVPTTTTSRIPSTSGSVTCKYMNYPGPRPGVAGPPGMRMSCVSVPTSTASFEVPKGPVQTWVEIDVPKSQSTSTISLQPPSTVSKTEYKSSTTFLHGPSTTTCPCYEPSKPDCGIKKITVNRVDWGSCHKIDVKSELTKGRCRTIRICAMPKCAAPVVTAHKDRCPEVLMVTSSVSECPCCNHYCPGTRVQLLEGVGPVETGATVAAHM